MIEQRKFHCVFCFFVFVGFFFPFFSLRWLIFSSSSRLGPMMLTPSQRYRVNYIALVLLGTLNNLVYVIVISAAQTLADSLGAQSQFGDITWATNITGLFTRGSVQYMPGYLNSIALIVEAIFCYLIGVFFYCVAYICVWFAMLVSVR
jgi:hypothetical protein